MSKDCVKDFNLEEIKEAGKRIDRSCRGTQEGYNRHIIEIKALRGGINNEYR